jgi:serine/threonine protein kinase
MSGRLGEGSLVGSRYRLDRLLGEGGFAVVWAATHVVTRRRVALKLLKDTYADDARVRQRFLREARAASAVRHPNVIAIQDVFETGGRPVIVMDLLHGQSLGARLKKKGAQNVQDVATIMLPVVSAVATAHAQGIVHRDLKPDNIFLAEPPDGADGPVEVKVLDFGIAKLTAREGDAAQSSGLTNTGALLGTPYYMSPEQVFGDGEVDHRSDVWSIGVILYECLAGVRPTQADTVGQIMKIIASESITPLEKRVGGLPADVTDIVKRAMSFDLEMRPTMRAVGEVLSAHTSVSVPEIDEATAPPEGLAAARSVSDETDNRASTQSPLTMSTGRRRATRRVLPAVAMALAGIAAAGIGVVAWRNNTSAPAQPLSSERPPVATVASTPASELPVAAAAPDSASTASTAKLPVPPGPSASAARVGLPATARGAIAKSPANSTSAPLAPPPAPDPASYR